MNPDPEVRKPNLVEVGPYVFSERRKKVVLNWNDNNSTVTYLQNRTWHFEPDLTVGTLDDVVTTLNVPAIRNGSTSYDGVYNMYTGKGTFEKFGELAEWNYNNHTEIYKSYCGKVNGSAGEFFKPNLEKESVHIFSSDICRSLKLVYQKEVLVDGIQGIRFVGDDDLFDTSPNNVKHSCYCNSTECPPQGVIDVSACKMNTPAFISNPHFRNADASYHRAVKGMHPNAKIHQLYIDLEQVTIAALNFVD
ncbi:unnamed protein product [Orchesella dallaii]|uniref:Protein croquemort n=1 Tax=Orchesella dallaii TaxID=48710 RepID=A0ABP1Q0K1_9HEXA